MTQHLRELDEKCFHFKNFNDLLLFPNRFPVVSIGIIRWVDCTVMEPSYFKLCTEHTPTHLALLDEVVACHPLLHLTVLRIFIVLFESKQHDLDVLVQVRLVIPYFSIICLARIFLLDD